MAIDGFRTIPDSTVTRLFATTSKEGVAKSKKALNHKDTKAQRKPVLSAGRSLGRPGKNFPTAVILTTVAEYLFFSPGWKPSAGR